MAGYSSGIQLDVDSISLSASEIRDAILNDNTEFSGSDIDAPISSAGEKATREDIFGSSVNYDRADWYVDVNGGRSRTFYSISGSGIITSLYVEQNNPNSTSPLHLMIDGNTVYSLEAIEKVNMGMAPFDSSIELIGTPNNSRDYDGNVEVSYVLD
jgi:hypothetical protein